MIGRKSSTLADRHARASLRANVAIVNFTETANALDMAADELAAVAAEALDARDALDARAEEADIQALQSRIRATKIRELIGA